MDSDNLDFSFKMEGIDRQAWLEAAAKELDLRKGPLGPGDKAPPETPEGAEARELKWDEAKFPVTIIDVYRITDKDFLARSREIPVKFSQLAKKFNFYWIRFPISLAPKRNWAFNMLEVRVEFNKGSEPHTRPVAYQILPHKQFQTLLQANDSLTVQLNENLELEAKTGVLEAELSVKTVVAAGAGLVLGPFTYSLKKAKIDHNTTGMEWVFWRLDGAEFFQENSPDLVVIAQVPKETMELKVHAEMQAYRYFSFASTSLQQAILHIPDIFRGFFQNGLPVYDTQSYDLTHTL